ncbi:hypothetical protein BJV77DRAFT_1151516 [Russula vinacea]|nr:hypothetical protein BJV77DRAFT_1151516 [Russula vinacea]
MYILGDVVSNGLHTDELASADEPLANLLFDYPGADIILRSQDTCHFRVPKIYIVNSSAILGELIQSTLDSPGSAKPEASFPVVHVPKRGEIIHCLLTLIFPVTPLVPSTPEEILELLSVAQMYQMDSVLTHIRDRIARQNSLPTRLEPALHIYALAQKYGLRQEALQSARTIMNYPMTIEEYDGKLDICLAHLFVNSGIIMKEFGPFLDLSSSQIPSWLDQYIESIGKSPNLFDSAELNTAMARHIKDKGNEAGCESLASVVDGSFEKAKSALYLVQERKNTSVRFSLSLTESKRFVIPDAPDADFIIRSSDDVSFLVHKLVLAVASPIFKDLLSLPQPSNFETVDGLPMVRLPESSELLKCLVSMLYPIPTVKPKSYEKKYKMVSVQASIRAEFDRGKFLPVVREGAEAFRAYAIASANRLISEMRTAARLTLDQPMTFEILGKGLRLFKGSALRDLVSFRKRRRDRFVACLDPFIKAQSMLGLRAFGLVVPPKIRLLRLHDQIVFPPDG